jgi:hypothetical protein
MLSRESVGPTESLLPSVDSPILPIEAPDRYAFNSENVASKRSEAENQMANDRREYEGLIARLSDIFHSNSEHSEYRGDNGGGNPIEAVDMSKAGADNQSSDVKQGKLASPCILSLTRLTFADA